MTAALSTGFVLPVRELIAGWASGLAEITSGGARVRLRVAPGASLVAGRLPRARITIPGLPVAGLELAGLDVRVRDVSLVPAWPMRLRARHMDVSVRVDQGALDRWMRARALPLRLVLRGGAMRARAGVGGVRLGEVDFELRLAGGQLRLVTRRANVLGVNVATMPPVPLPLPLLPRSAELVSVDPTDGALALLFSVTDVDEPVTVQRMRWVVAALRRTSRATRVADDGV